MAEKTLSETIAEGRRLIAEATPGPVRAGRSDMISYGADDDRPYKNIYVGAATASRARNDVPDDLAKVWGVNCVADATLFAFAVNNLDALLDVAEAAAAVQSAMQCYLDSGRYHPYRALLDKHAALDSALSRLRGVR